MATLMTCCTCLTSTSAQTLEGRTYSGQPTGQKPFPITSYKELPNPVSPNANDWKKVKDLTVSWGSTDVRYKKEAPAIGVGKSITLTAWKGERIAAQFLVSTNKPLNRLTYSISNLVSSKFGYTIKNDRQLTGFVRYVMTDELNKDGNGGCGDRTDTSAYDSTLVADPIDHLTGEIALSAQSTQGVWVGIRIPQDATSGLYQGTVTVNDGEKVIGKLKLQLNVINRTLPAPTQWAFHLDLWQNPFAIARYHQVKLWSKEHFEAMKPYMEMYRDAGGKVITTSIMHKPWNGQTYDYYESMVTWMKKLDGTWSFDFAVFDKWIEFMKSVGMEGEINCYSMIPWALSFQYFDQATNRLQTLKTQPGDKEYEEVWSTFLQAFASHLKAKGWFDRTCISMDERPMKTMQKTISLIRRVDKDFKISLAGNLYDNLSDDLYDYCTSLHLKHSGSLLAKRKAAGMITTFYTCCTEAKPNTFTFSAPAEAEWLGWYSAAKNLDGYTRWCLCHWPIEPLLDSRFYSWAAGDTYLIYPGARTSIRFERLVSGIQAFEKVRILKAELTKEHQRSGLKKIETALKSFDEVYLDKEPASKAVNKANQLINGFN